MAAAILPDRTQQLTPFGEPILRLWLVRHALVAQEALAYLYGTDDVPICESSMVTHANRYAALAARLPQPAQVVITPLSRTRLTFEALIRAGYPRQEPLVRKAFVEQDFGEWQGRAITEFSNRLIANRHPFWPIHAAETPPGGESFQDLIHRVGEGMEHLSAAHRAEDVILISHGGAIRAACAYALGLSPHQALSLSIDNISLTRLERHDDSWRLISLNEQLST
jgi:alpha-ribazole phosphatase